jgi:hypothetical protein
MTWDLVAFRSPEGIDPLETSQLVLAALNGGDGSFLPPIDREAMALLLRLRIPELARRAADMPSVAMADVVEEEERPAVDQLELWWKGVDVGVQVAITDFAVCVALPFGRDDADDDTIRALARLVRTFRRDAGLHVYDPQAERLVDVPGDGDLIH